MAEDDIVLYGTVGDSFWGEQSFSAQDVRDALRGRAGPVTLRLNSGGGVATEGMAIYTILRDYPGEVTVVVDAIAASAASLLAMAGDRIVMRRGSVLLIHDPASPWTEGRGTESDHLLQARQLGVLSNAYAEVYATRAGISREEAREIMRAETLMDGSVALQMGFATATDDTPADVVASFDYRIYAHAPPELRAGCERFGTPEPEAALAMMAGISRCIEKGTVMTVDTSTHGAAEVTTTAVPLMAQIAIAAGQPDASIVAARADAVTIAERTRARRITEAVAMVGLPVTLAATLIDNGSSEVVALDAILRARQAAGDATAPIAISRGSVMVDQREKFVEGASRAIMHKNRMGGERNEFTSLSLSELARHSLALNGHGTRFNDRQ
jgi:ATP-dependent protease ClpP protease subunit